MALLDKLNFHGKLIHLLTEFDRKESKRKGYNPNALALYFEAAEGVKDAQTFADSFTPTRGMHSIAKRLELGLDVDRGQWVVLAEKPDDEFPEQALPGMVEEPDRFTGMPSKDVLIIHG